ncbi:MAG: hypothetical protein M3323_04645 [Actinomycetota bacterium]|nr:hypothetical protein [Actinomycetota bacterium]
MSIVVVWVVDVAVALGSWVLIWIGRETNWLDVFEPAVVGLAMSVIGISTLVGIYAGSGGPKTKMRNSIAAGFSTTYIYLLTSLLVLGDFADSLGPLASEILDNFTVMVTTIVGFYFVSRATENVNAAIQTRKTTEAVGAGGGGVGGLAADVAPAAPAASALDE